jgi:hypothetical protein
MQLHCGLLAFCFYKQRCADGNRCSPGFDKRFQRLGPSSSALASDSNGRLPLVGEAFALFAAEIRNRDVEARGFRKI